MQLSVISDDTSDLHNQQKKEKNLRYVASPVCGKSCMCQDHPGRATPTTAVNVGRGPGHSQS